MESHRNSLRSRAWSVAALAALVAALVAPSAAAAGKTLEDMLPEDTAAVVRVTGLHDAWKKLGDSALRRKIEFSAIPDVANGFAKARQDIQAFEQQTGINLVDTFASIFGRDFALAMLPSGEGLFIGRTADKNDLQLAVDTIVAMEQNDGKIHEDHTEAYNGVEIRSMKVADKAGGPAKARLHALMDDFILIGREAATLKQTIDRYQGRAKTPNLAASKGYQEARKRMDPKALATLYVNTPLLGKTALLDNLSNGKLKNPGARQIFQRIKGDLASTKFLVASLNVSDTGAKIASSFLFDETKVTEAIKSMRPRRGNLDILRLMPADAVAAVANQFDKTALWNSIVASVEQTDPQAAKRLKMRLNQFSGLVGALDFELDFLPQLGDQLALFMTEGNEEKKERPALALVLEKTPKAVFGNSIRTYIGIAALQAQQARNQGREPDADAEMKDYQGVRLATVFINKGEMADLGVEPTFFEINKYMVLTTSRESARSLIDAYRTSAGAATLKDPDGSAVATRGRINVRRLSRMGEVYKEWLVNQGIKEGKTAAKANEDVLGLQFVLSLMDAIEFNATHHPGRIDRDIVIRMTK